MASGLGKTLTTIFDLQQFLQECPNAHILYLCHQESILAQSKRKFRKFFGEEYSYGMYTGNYKTTHTVTFLFATFQSMHNHREEFVSSVFDYIVVDEAHHTAANTYQPTPDYFEPQFLVGLTATKDRPDGRDILETYDQVLFQMDIYDGWAEGWLARVDYRVMLDDLNQEEFEKYVGPQASNEKVSIAQLNKTIFAPKRDEEIVASIREQTADLENPSIFVFCSNIDHANAMAYHFGGEAAVIHSGQSPSLNEAILSSFRSGDIRIIISVNMLNEGIDVPEADVVVFLRATESSIIFFQQLGRGLRISGEKRTVRVLDYVANIERIAMILEMEETAKKRTESTPNYSPSAKPDPIVVDIPATKFRVERVDVERLLTQIVRRKRWTKEEALTVCRLRAEELGRCLTVDDLRFNPTLPSYSTILCLFPSWPAFCEELGFSPSRKPQKAWTTETVRSAILSKAKDGIMPSFADLDNDPDMPDRTTIIRYIAPTLPEIAQALGLSLSKRTMMILASDEDVLLEYHTIAKKLGHWPTMKQLLKESKLITNGTLRARFGSAFKAQERAVELFGEIDAIAGELTIQKIAPRLQALARRIQRVPTRHDVNDDPRLPSYVTCLKLCGGGGMDGICRACGVYRILEEECSIAPQSLEKDPLLSNESRGK